MAINKYDRVDFFSYDHESKEEKKVCSVYLVKGKLVYEGERASGVEKMVNDDDYLKPFREISPYAVLDRLQFAFKSTFFYATGVVGASAL
jgi:hypothetical protein